MASSKESESAESASATGFSRASPGSVAQLERWQTYRDLLPDSSDPPQYQQFDILTRERVQQLASEAHNDGQDFPIRESPGLLQSEANPAAHRAQAILSTYFNAITTKKDEIVALFIKSNLVTTESTNVDGRTPLLAAIEVGNIRTVQQLMDYDADVNAYGMVSGMPEPRYGKKPAKIYRTPLQLAAEKGNLTIVKLLMETYGADDSLIAPDGELALRLAAANGHREVVEYLPLRRGGGFRRWKTKHHKAMRRAKEAGKKIFWFFRVIVYEVPKFFVYTVPKHLIVLPIIRGVKWMHRHRNELPQIIITWVKRMGKKMWRFFNDIPKAMKDFVQWIWKGIKKMPQGAKIMLLWIWSGLKSTGTVVANIFTRFFSFVHTALTALVSFFRRITIRDVWNGFVFFLHALVIDGPKRIWEWLCKFERMAEAVFETLFGFLGTLLWCLIRGIVELFIYLPKKLLVILASIANSIEGGFKEILIWINPKRQ
ncbi:hypothetical protein CC78DRAFT_535918 [Lojkania enalia]|uniref:Ankyrin n=1 Tax=Lojkania enalia TaxID=147567 RepID=A0A9P4K6J3_9PLEO|nr:hypothetical protein CC78DRAFT_535918 [Didymosphaeria enalia]